MNLAEKRNKRGMTQSGLAEIVGVTRQHISRIELGACDPSPRIAQKIAKALGIKNWSDLYGGENNGPINCKRGRPKIKDE